MLRTATPLDDMAAHAAHPHPHPRATRTCTCTCTCTCTSRKQHDGNGWKIIGGDTTHTRRYNMMISHRESSSDIHIVMSPPPPLTHTMLCALPDSVPPHVSLISNTDGGGGSRTRAESNSACRRMWAHRHVHRNVNHPR